MALKGLKKMLGDEVNYHGEIYDGLDEKNAGNFGVALDFFSDAEMRPGTLPRDFHHCRSFCLEKVGRF
jgi:hypothetical protein